MKKTYIRPAACELYCAAAAILAGSKQEQPDEPESKYDFYDDEESSTGFGDNIWKD